MRIFEERYFNINRKLQICLGLWPYEMKSKKIIFRAFIIGAMTLLTIPQMISIILHYENIDRLMFSILGFTTMSIMNLKVIGIILAEENIKVLLKSIANNWKVIEDQKERDILYIYSERARTVTIYYSVFMVIAASGSLLPLIPKLLDIVSPLENPRPDIYITEGEFFIDRECHFMLIFSVDCVSVMIVVLVIMTVDTMYIVSAEHCCALYAIIGYRSSQLMRRVQESSTTTKDDDSYQWLLHTIQLHQNALNFVSLLDDSYSTTFLFLLIAALHVLPLISCAIIAQLHNLLHLIAHIIYLVALMIHGFFIALPGQRIIDHQLSLAEATYFNGWYTAPLRTKKLLLIFMLRCSKLSPITAGGLLPINFEVYFKIMKTAISYITVASSFR